MLPKQKVIYAVHTQQRAETGQRPYYIGGYSALQVATAWQRRYHEQPLKVVRARWNADGSWTEDEGLGIWKRS